jgi:CRP/FNR family cyclic AMP-dependent transcriptional regulator
MDERQTTRLSKELVAELTRRGRRRVFERGELIFSEGEQSDCLYLLEEGELKVFTCGSNGRELVYNLLHPGELFGELILDGGPRTASVRAVTRSTCILVGVEAFRALMREQPDLAEVLVQRLIGRVRHATGQLRAMALEDVYQRVTTLLNEVASFDGESRVVDKLITQQEIANRIGATREMVNLIIRELIRGGFLVRDRVRGLVFAKELPKHW